MENHGLIQLGELGVRELAKLAKLIDGRAAGARGRLAALTEGRFAALTEGRFAFLPEGGPAALAVGLSQAIQGRLNPGCGRRVAPPIGFLPGQQEPSLLGLGGGDENQEFVQRLSALLEPVYLQVGCLEARLARLGEKEQSDEKSDQQQGRQGDVPSAVLA